MKDQLIDTWQINNRMNLLLMDNISDAGMQKSLSTRGGRTVSLQLVHVHNVRMEGRKSAPKTFFPLTEPSGQDPVEKYKVPDKEAAFDRKVLRKAFEDSAKGMEE
jgi:hypothetical protein